MKAVQTIWFLHLQQVSTVVATYTVKKQTVNSAVTAQSTEDEVSDQYTTGFLPHHEYSIQCKLPSRGKVVTI